MDNIEISLGKFRLEIFLVYISSGGQRWGGVWAKLGQSLLSTKNEFPFEWLRTGKLSSTLRGRGRR